MRHAAFCFAFSLVFALIAIVLDGSTDGKNEGDMGERELLQERIVERIQEQENLNHEAFLEAEKGSRKEQLYLGRTSACRVALIIIAEEFAKDKE